MTRNRWSRRLLVLPGVLVLACGQYEPLAVPPRSGAPYLALLTRTQAPAGVTPPPFYRYRVKESSLTLGIDTTVSVSPTDTLVMSLPPASYEVEIDGVPDKCRVQGGASRQSTVLAAETNTAILRFVVFCQAQLVIENLTDGQQRDEEFVYRVAGAGGERTGLIRSADTVLLDGLEPGDYAVRLAHVGGNCIVVSDGGAEQLVAVKAVGTVQASFRVACSDPRAAPAITAVTAQYRDGVSAFTIRARDPDRDIERYFWDLTDCRRKSLIGDGGRSRGGLSGGRTRGQDSVVVLGAIEVGLPDSVALRGCVAIRVVDQFGNSSDLVEQPMSPIAGQPPFPLSFNARLFGTSVIQTILTADDPDGDFLGVFATATMRDGALGPPDGRPDIGLFNTAGYLDTNLPDVPLGNGRPPYTEYLAIVVYLFDRAGHFVRVEDRDLFR